MRSKVGSFKAQFTAATTLKLSPENILSVCEVFAVGGTKPNPSPDLEFCLWDNSRSRAELGTQQSHHPSCFPAGFNLN